MLDCRQLGGLVLIVEGTAIADWATRAAELFGVPRLRISFRNRTTSADPAAEMLLPTASATQRDWLAVSLADRVEALFVRTGGKVETFLRRRLEQRRDSTTRVSVSPQWRGAGQALIKAGAIGWYRSGEPATNPDPGTEADAQAVIEPWMSAAGQWLIHCTRGTDAAWPGQTSRQYLDAMLLSNRNEHEHGPLATLERMVWTGQLVAAAGASERATPVVCFSARSLTDLLARRCYRAHLHRWDYEPFGIAIRHDLAQMLGVQPVIYGEPSERERLPDSQRYLFQPRGCTYDWTEELEWRYPANIDLTQLDPTGVRVFVSSQVDSRRLNQRSRWPVSVVPDLQPRRASSNPSDT